MRSLDLSPAGAAGRPADAGGQPAAGPARAAGGTRAVGQPGAGPATPAGTTGISNASNKQEGNSLGHLFLGWESWYPAKSELSCSV